MKSINGPNLLMFTEQFCLERDLLIAKDELVWHKNKALAKDKDALGFASKVPPSSLPLSL